MPQVLLWEDGLVATCRTGWGGERPGSREGAGMSLREGWRRKGNEREDESDFRTMSSGFWKMMTSYEQ